MNLPDSRYWRDRAACRMSDAALFDPPTKHDRSGEGKTRLRQARTICRSCPVQAMCLDDAVSNGDSGVFAGQLLDNGVPIPDPKYRPATKFPEPRMVGGRPLSSYYGPAAPEVIAELLDALAPAAPGNRARDETIMRLAAAGLSNNEIAPHVGLTRQGVQSLRRRAKVSSAA